MCVTPKEETNHHKQWIKFTQPGLRPRVIRSLHHSALLSLFCLGAGCIVQPNRGLMLLMINPTKLTKSTATDNQNANTAPLIMTLDLHQTSFTVVATHYGNFPHRHCDFIADRHMAEQRFLPICMLICSAIQSNDMQESATTWGWRVKSLGKNKHNNTMNIWK